MSTLNLLLSRLLLGAALLAAPLHSAVLVTWTGTILNGIDDSNVFGTGAGADLTGRSFTAVYTIDPTVGTLTSSPDFASLNGGILSSVLTINGQTYSFGSNSFNRYQRDATLNRSEIYTEVNDLHVGATDILFLTEFRTDNSIPFTGLNESLAIATTNARGVFQAFDATGTTRLFAGNFTPTFVTIATSTPGGGGNVPEPSTAILLLSAAGAMLLHRARR